ncbi:glycoside hydrolase family 13 protein [Clostridium sp. DJ247]|uniref:glycoside hydrolase family 13 protein n=1 Tax=Clostridium sp. DJ247 TaxID=2726188 RepID=UPI00162A8E79|nr:glycoside hydrolase family 13 protein [Clostridium sp. DJ247]MBC2579516.1 alpha-glycosidase [Clostridium sp. DJ247]
MLKEAIYHKVYSDYAYALSKEDLLIKIRTKKDDIKKINLIYLDKYKYSRNKETFTTKMKKVASDSLFDYYEAAIQHDFISVNYFFELMDDQEVLYYGNYLFSTEQPDDGSELFHFPVMAEKDLFIVPEWAKESIIYEIFPERYHNGDKSNDPENVKPWYSKVDGEIMLGGDLQGIIDKLDYIEDLGVNVIYMTPIFKAGSNHKYNTYDYFEIDPQFGTLETLKELVKKAHRRNIRVILDAVFNHSGTEFLPFMDVREKGEKSEYKDWFDIRKFPVEMKADPDYSTFAYEGYMPKLMTKNEATKKYLIDVATYWIKEADIDGWRLDVADEIDHHFWREFRQAVKAAKPDALIVGEVWYDSSSWLQGDEFDSVMNYVFTSAVKDFVVFNKISSKELGERLEFIRGLYKLPAYNVLWNLIGSHDTPRFLHIVGEDVEKLKLAAFIQLTFTGMPMIYYGDEIGMTGAADPDCRKGMIWNEEKQNKSLKEYYKKLISIRKENKVFTHGDFTTVLADELTNIYGFRRELNGEVIEGYINNGDKSQSMEIKVSRTAIDLISNKTYTPVKGKITIDIPEKSGMIIKL